MALHRPLAVLSCDEGRDSSTIVVPSHIIFTKYCRDGWVDWLSALMIANWLLTDYAGKEFHINKSLDFWPHVAAMAFGLIIFHASGRCGQVQALNHIQNTALFSYSNVKHSAFFLHFVFILCIPPLDLQNAADWWTDDLERSNTLIMF